MSKSYCHPSNINGDNSVTHSWKPIPHFRFQHQNLYETWNQWTGTKHEQKQTWISITTSGGTSSCGGHPLQCHALGNWQLTRWPLADRSTNHLPILHPGNGCPNPSKIIACRLYSGKLNHPHVWVRYLCIFLILDTKYTIKSWGCVYETINAKVIGRVFSRTPTRKYPPCN